MASKVQALILILLSLLTFSFTIKSSQAATGGIAIYWGQNNGDGSLTSTCDTGNFEIVILAFLNTFGCGRTPDWNFAGHCGPWSPCTKLQPEIVHCQEKGVKVFLSLGGAPPPPPTPTTYSLCSRDEAKDLADYLYENFLSDQFGPLGKVTLDGIDFDIEVGDNYWDDLAKDLDALRRKNKYFYLSAAPQCPIPDRHLDKAIKTGLFDYVFVQFYNNPDCQYSPSDGTGKLLKAWDAWTNLLRKNNTLFMGLPAGPSIRGYIPPNVLTSDKELLPHIKATSNYGGIMLWDRFLDVDNNYSNQIKHVVPKNVLRFVTAVSDAISECVSAALHRMAMIPKPY